MDINPPPYYAKPINPDSIPSHENQPINLIASAPILDDDNNLLIKEEDIIYNLNSITSPNCNEQEIYINDFLKNNNITVLPFIKCITTEISNKTNILLKFNCDNIKYILNPTYEQWMFVYKTIKDFEKFKKYLKLNDKHNYSFCKILLHDNYKFIEFINKEIISQELCDIAFINIHKNNDYEYMDFIPKNFQSQEIQEKMVLKDGINLKYIASSPLDICKLAVENNVDAIININPKWFHYTEVYKIAIEKDPLSIKYIKDNHVDYEELCILAVKKNPHSLEHIRNKLPTITSVAIEKNYNVLKYISRSLQIYQHAVEINPNSIIYISNNYCFESSNDWYEYYKLCGIAVKKNGLLLEHVKYFNFSYKSNYEHIKNLAVLQNHEALMYIDKQFIVDEKCTIL